MSEKNETKMLSARIPAATIRDIKVLAATSDRTVATLLDEAIRDLLQKYEKKAGK